MFQDVKHGARMLVKNPGFAFIAIISIAIGVGANAAMFSLADGLVLRYGWFYGPGTSIALDPPGSQIELIRKRQFPIVGAGTGIWSFIHIEDAASATVAAVEGGPAGVYNVVDEEPAAVSDFLPVLAAAVGAKRPRRVPRWVGRLAAGEMAVMSMTELRGASNDKAKRELGWRPRHASWREGFEERAAA